MDSCFTRDSRGTCALPLLGAIRKLNVLNVSARIGHAEFLDALDSYDIALPAPS